MSYAVGRRGNAGSVRLASNGAERFRGLRVSHDGAVGGIDSREVSILGKAFDKSVIFSDAGVVESTANAIVDVLTIIGSVCTIRVAYFETEGVAPQGIRQKCYFQ